MAAYGAQRWRGATDKQAIQYLYKLFHHVPVQPDSARAALQIFAQGKGDVLLTYENEAIYANRKGVHTDYVIPGSTILIESPAALTKSGARHPEAKAFLKYLYSATAQKVFGELGYRPVVKLRASGFKFKQPKGLFTISTKKVGLNGWKAVQPRFFKPNTSVMAKVERSIGQ
jgi:sulfate transport system substrate-binding protein